MLLPYSILLKPGVEVGARLAGDIESVRKELRSSEPDVRMVGYELKPELTIKFPLYPYSRSADLMNGGIQLVMGGGSSFYLYLQNWCRTEGVEMEVIGG